jgi:ferredoxin-NADP reductase
LKEPNSRGGSIEIHESVNLGTRLTLRGPKNHFPLHPGEPTIFIAGGIGITPLLPMMRSLTNSGKPWVLHYGGKSLAALAYLDALQLMDGNEVNIYLKNETRRIPVKQIMQALSRQATVYVCGPESMIAEVEDTGNELGIEVRLERFGPTSHPVAEGENFEFEVTLERSGKTLLVPKDERLIDVVRTVVPSVPFSCEEGYCGSCETTVIEGTPDHRDSILSAEEKAANECMMICVGRSKGERLVLDL